MRDNNLSQSDINEALIRIVKSIVSLRDSNYSYSKLFFLKFLNNVECDINVAEAIKKARYYNLYDTDYGWAKPSMKSFFYNSETELNQFYQIPQYEIKSDDEYKILRAAHSIILSILMSYYDIETYINKLTSFQRLYIFDIEIQRSNNSIIYLNKLKLINNSSKIKTGFFCLYTKKPLKDIEHTCTSCGGTGKKYKYDDKSYTCLNIWVICSKCKGEGKEFNKEDSYEEGLNVDLDLLNYYLHPCKIKKSTFLLQKHIKECPFCRSKISDSIIMSSDFSKLNHKELNNIIDTALKKIKESDYNIDTIWENFNRIINCRISVDEFKVLVTNNIDVIDHRKYFNYSFKKPERYSDDLDSDREYFNAITDAQLGEYDDFNGTDDDLDNWRGA